MTHQEWATVLAFAAAVYGVSVVSPEAAVMIAGLGAIYIAMNAGIFDRFTKGVTA